MNNKPNTRQWKLYQYIKEYSLKGEWKNREDIQADLIALYPRTKTDKYNDAGLRLITKDIQALNKSSIPHKVILCDSYKGIKMATKNEYEHILTNEKIRILSELQRYYKKIKKISLNGQHRLKLSPYQKIEIQSILQEIL